MADGLTHFQLVRDLETEGVDGAVVVEGYVYIEPRSGERAEDDRVPMRGQMLFVFGQATAFGDRAKG
jgi:hypothetical protein